MSDSPDPPSMPSTLPPPKMSTGEQASIDALLLIDAKLDRLTDHVQRLSLLAEDVFAAVEEDRLERRVMRDRIAALERIPPVTMLPPPNGHG